MENPSMTEVQAENQDRDQTRSINQLPRLWMKYFRMNVDFFLTESSYSNIQNTIFNALLSLILYSLFNLLSIVLAKTIDQPNKSTETLFDILGFRYPLLTSSLYLLLIGLVFFFGFQGMIYFGSKVLGGAGELATQIYLQSLILVPLSIINGLLLIGFRFPALNLIVTVITYLSNIFALLVIIRALKAAHRFSSLRAVAALLLSPLFFLITFGCLLLAIFPGLTRILEGILDKLFM
jgi:hypothetical protein